MINPYANRDTTNRNIRIAERGARIVATITTSIGAFIWGQDLAGRYLPTDWPATPALTAIAGMLAGGVMGFLTDFMFGNLLQRVCTDAIMRRHPNVVAYNGPSYFSQLRRIESWIFAILLIGLLALDVYTTVVIRDPIADSARTTDQIDIAAVTAGVSQQQKNAADPMAAQIKALDQRITAEERRIAAANAGLTKLIREEKNTWAAQTLARKKDRATADLRRQRDELTAAYNRTLAGQGAALTATQTHVNDENARISAANQRNRHVMAGMYMAFTIGPKALSIILRILMVVTFFAYSTTFTPDLTGDGIIDYADVEAYYRQSIARSRARASAHTATPPRTPSADFDDIQRTPSAPDFT